MSLPSASWFWDMVSVGTANECWPWTGSVHSKAKPYGRFYVGKRVFPAHRFALLLAAGPHPRGANCACHTCDNPICCNPNHLWWGTPQQNDADCVAKGRKVRPRERKIDREEACRLRDEGWSYSMIADRFGVNQSSVGRVLKLSGRSGSIAVNGVEMAKRLRAREQSQ